MDGMIACCMVPAFSFSGQRAMAEALGARDGGIPTFFFLGESNYVYHTSGNGK